MNEEDVVTIGDSAFKDFTKLSSVNILSSVKLIDHDAFQNCTSLTAIILSGNSVVPSINTAALNGIGHTVSVYIPEGMLTSYMENTNWAQLENNLCVDFIECQQQQQVAASLMLDDGSTIDVYGDHVTSQDIEPYKDNIVDVEVGEAE